jgi:hypothetical protein
MNDTPIYRHPYFLGVITAIAGALVIGFTTRGAFTTLVVCAILAFWVALPTAAILAFLAALLKQHRKTLTPMAVMMAILAAGLLGAIGIGWILGGMDAHDAMQKAEQIAAALDQHKSEHGAYPPALDAALADPRVKYELAGDRYVLTALDRRIGAQAWRYSSDKPTWRVGEE